MIKLMVSGNLCEAALALDLEKKKQTNEILTPLSSPL